MAQEFKLSTKDLFELMKRKKSRLVGLILFFSFICILYTLTSPIRYRAEGSFREKGKSNSSFDTKAAMVLIGANKSESEIEPIFKSRRVISGVVKSLGLQASVNPSPSAPGFFERIFLNLMIEWAYFRNMDEALFEDVERPFIFSDLEYSLDARRTFSLHIEKKSVTLKDKITGKEFKGFAGDPIIGDDFKITIWPQKAIEGSIYHLTLKPLTKTIKDVTAHLKVQADKNDKSLIKLSFAADDRMIAKQTIEALMNSYLSYLEDEQKTIHDKQITYLERRQIESFDALKIKMELHAQELAKDALSYGFIGSDKAIQFFAGHQEQLQAKKEQVDLLIKTLRDVAQQDSISIERLLGVIDLPTLSQKVQQLGDMRSLRDSLSLALFDPSGDFDKEVFTTRVSEWEHLQNESIAIDRLIVALDEKGMVENIDCLNDKTKFFVDFWQDQLNRSSQAFHAGSKENFYPLFDDYCRKKESFRNYLTNLKNFADVQSTTLQEELIYSKEFDEEFKGIDLTLSQDLFKRYMVQVEDLQAQERHLGFLKSEIRDESFAISSLSSILQDSISSDLVNRAAALEMAINDPKNRSEKEQSRMKDELLLERNFLWMHIDQTLHLNQIKQGLLKEKFTSLQRATLGFLHRQISFFEHQIKDLIQSKIGSLEQERELYQEQIQNLGDQLATYPEKWVRDELLKQTMQLQQLQAQEITRIVESKNIAANLELVQSSPLDESFPPPLPVTPMVPVFGFLGAVLGLIVGVCSILASTVFSGIPATRGNLDLQNQTVLGSLVKIQKPLLNQDLETFRAILTNLAKHRAKSVLIASSWGDQFADYLAQTDKRVLILSLDFNTPYQPDGLFSYLKDGLQFKIKEGRLDFGGTTRAYLELLCQKSFHDLLKQFEAEYDIVVASIPCSPISSTIDYLRTLFDVTILGIKEETLEELSPFFKIPSISYVIESIG